MTRLTFLLGLLLLLFPVDALADEGESSWSPNGSLPGQWETVATDQTQGTYAIPTHRRELCDVTRSEWHRSTDDVVVMIDFFDCHSDRYAGLVADHQQKILARPPRPGSLFGPDIDFLIEFTGPAATVRGWAQGERFVKVVTVCGALVRPECDQLNVEASRGISSALAGSPQPRESLAVDAVSKGLINYPLALWLMFVGVPLFIRRSSAMRFAVPASMPAWTDVTPAARRLKLRTLLWGTVTGLRRLLYVISVLMIVGPWADVSRQDLIVALLLLVVAAALIPASKALYPSSMRHRLRLRDYVRNVNVGWKGWLGLAIRGTTRLGVALLLFSYLIVIVFYAMGGKSGREAQALFERLGEKLTNGESPGPYEWYTATLAMLSDDIDFSAFLVLMGITACVVLDRLGARLSRGGTRQPTGTNAPPSIVYLRSFDDDRRRLEASRLSRRGLMGRLSFTRTKFFEELVISRTEHIGPNFAAEQPHHWINPRSWLPSLGTTKEPLSMNEWITKVEEESAKALFVIVLATPHKINEEGFGRELEMINSSKLGHSRIMLVLGTRRRKKNLANAWKQFCNKTEGKVEKRDSTVFDGITTLGADGAAQVMVHVEGRGWAAWGAVTRSEWTYSVALHQALDYAVPLWRTELGVTPGEAGSANSG